jgi:hypothetical protein
VCSWIMWNGNPFKSFKPQRTQRTAAKSAE